MSPTQSPSMRVSVCDGVCVLVCVSPCLCDTPMCWQAISLFAVFIFFLSYAEYSSKGKLNKKYNTLLIFSILLNRILKAGKYNSNNFFHREI